MIIYKTTNLLNGKIYIGKDRYNNENYLGSGKILKQAIQKYGRDNFNKEILEECQDEKLWLKREVYWIEYFNSTKVGYNIALGGNGGDTISNNPNKDDIRKRHSEKMKDPNVNKNKARGRKPIIKKRDDPSWINPRLGKESPLKGRSSGKKGIPNQKHSEWMKDNNPFRGKTHSEEHKQKLKEINSKPKSEEHKRKISETLKGNKPGNMTKVVINDKLYESLSEAARQLNLSTSTIKNRLKSKSDKFKSWMYLRDMESLSGLWMIFESNKIK
jgi:group I intron endonuclease